MTIVIVLLALILVVMVFGDEGRELVGGLLGAVLALAGLALLGFLVMVVYALATM